MTTWVNPHPEKEIAKIVITNRDLPVAERRFLTHLAVTVALQSEVKGPAGPVRDAKKSQALLQDAIAMKQAKKNAEAVAKLEEAIKADDQNVGAWVTLTEIRSETDGVEAFTSLCKRWFAAMPTNYQAHNVLGKYLEAKGKLADALAEYKKSLELEWNQPPTLEAKARVEKQLNPK
jgi:Tfp pilus assembly protein PilF